MVIDGAVKFLKFKALAGKIKIPVPPISDNAPRKRKINHKRYLELVHFFFIYIFSYTPKF
jgi:hypothetical protein